MKYALGNMLNGAGGLNPDGLSLDLQFATDKTLVARKGPTPVFTRGSSATQVGASGLIEYAPENLALQSENFGTTWTNSTGNALTLNDALSPTGTLTADRVDFPATAAAGLVRTITQNFGSTVAGNGAVTASVWLRTVSGTSTVYLTLLDGGPPWLRFHVACNVTTEWTRFSVTLNAPTSTLYLLIGPDTRTGSGTPAQPAVQDAASVYAWGAQLERSSTARAYIPTTTAAISGARFDHDPATLACKGLLIEESRTNSITGSNAFNTWTLANCTVAASSIVTPEGTADAWKIVEDIILAVHSATRPFTPVSGTTYTVSAWIKSAENGFAFVGLTGGGFAATFISVNLSTGAVSTAVGTPVGAASASYSNGWWRVSFSLAATASLSSVVDIRLSRDGNWANRSYLGNGVNGMYCYGAQVEAGSFPTSYIPTATASLARSADVCSITGANFSGIWNGIDATVFFRGSRITNISGQSNWALSSGTLATSVVSDRSASFERLAVAGSGIINRSPFTTLQEYKIATAIKTSDYAASFNGEAAIASANIFALSLSAFAIGTTYTGGGQLNGWIHSIKFFKKRLPNAKLQTLTT